MDIKKVLITDEISEKVVDGLRAADLIVDVASDITSQRLVAIVEVSPIPLVCTETCITAFKAERLTSTILPYNRTMMQSWCVREPVLRDR